MTIDPHRDPHHAATIDSPVGRLTVVVSRRGLRAVLWPHDPPARVPLPPLDVEASPVLDRVVAALREYFAGTRTTFAEPLDLRGSAFQVAVWEALTAVEFGTTTTYGALAARLGRPTAARAIGAAVGRNPVSIIVPCHRVVGTDGRLTGFAGGLPAKAWLLDHERVVSNAA